MRIWRLTCMFGALGCANAWPADPRSAEQTPRSALTKPAPALSREDWNRLAQALDRPLFWARDERNPGVIDPDEIAVRGFDPDREMWIKDGEFTPLFHETVRAMVEQRRLLALRLELDQGRATLVQTDLRKESAPVRSMVAHLVAAARIVEELYAIQTGAALVQGCMRPDDALSQAVFRRNQGPWCQAARTREDPFCNACPGFPPRRSGLYPLALQDRPGFCKELAARSDADKLLSPFTAIRERADGALEAVPYHRFFGERLGETAKALRAAADALGSEESAFQAYLRAAARAFQDGSWEEADEAFAAMGSAGSRFYLRVGPDEVYADVCHRKAGFHMSFGLLDPASHAWQQRLTPLRQEMEAELAGLIGPPYKAREVNVRLPDFVAVALNAGDSRSALGATVGQSLPNWGKVAGRGRTVAISNLTADPDSLAVQRTKAAAVLAPEVFALRSEGPRLLLLDIILHEAAHNFGPHSDYRIGGSLPGAIFSGPTAMVLEELKAQSMGMLLLDFLARRGALSAPEVQAVLVEALTWAFGQMAFGLDDGRGGPRPYGQVGAIIVGQLVDAGGLRWEAAREAANGRDRGCFALDSRRATEILRALVQRVGQIKARGDRAGAEALIGRFVAGEGPARVHLDEIRERLLRFPKESYLYSLQY